MNTFSWNMVRKIYFSQDSRKEFESQKKKIAGLQIKGATSSLDGGKSSLSNLKFKFASMGLVRGTLILQFFLTHTQKEWLLSSQLGKISILNFQLYESTYVCTYIGSKPNIWKKFRDKEHI